MQHRTSASFPVLAMVASAGGLAAVRSVLGGIPDPLPAALLVLVHQDPDRTSRLPELLESVCSMPVRHAKDEELTPGQVLVAPPGRHLLVTPRRRIALLISGAFPPNRPSADLLLTTMALSLRRDAIAVILSGRGHDGATGATAVHDFGGYVITADQASSKEFSMPAATTGRDDAADETLPVDAIGPRLTELVQSRRH